MKYITLVVLWFVFIVCAVIAGLACIPALLLGETTYAAHIVRALDKVLASLLGWDGKNTTSWECAQSNCIFCKALCYTLNWVLEKRHCDKQLL